MTCSAADRTLHWTVAAFALILLWDASGLDLVLAGLAGTPAGFPLRDQWFLIDVMHEGAKALSWGLLAALFVCIPWPMGALRRLTKRERVQLAGTALLSVLAVSLIKRTSTTSCPWDLQVFGGVALHVSHWAWGLRDGGPGNCFPAGHAAAAFAYAGGYFALRRGAPRFARAWLFAACAAGLGQQLRGAHYMSHTLWTAWVCWAVGLGIDVAIRWGWAFAAPKLNES
jgi:membrane-associated PAP2 superfamily phosphatase